MLKADLPARYRKTGVGRLAAMLSTHAAVPYEVALTTLMPPLGAGVVPSAMLRMSRRDNAQKALTRLKVLLHKYTTGLTLARFKTETGVEMVALTRRVVEVAS